MSINNLVLMGYSLMISRVTQPLRTARESSTEEVPLIGGMHLLKKIYL